MQQCRFVYTITRADCRACNGLDAGCRNYWPLPCFVIGRVALAEAGAESRAGPCTRHKMDKF